MYNQQDVQFAGKHDFDRDSAKQMQENKWANTFSIGIFQWQLSSNKKKLKKGPVKVRVRAANHLFENAIQMAECIVMDLDNEKWDGRETVSIK